MGKGRVELRVQLVGKCLAWLIMLKIFWMNVKGHGRGTDPCLGTRRSHGSKGLLGRRARHRLAWPPTPVAPQPSPPDTTGTDSYVSREGLSSSRLASYRDAHLHNAGMKNNPNPPLLPAQGAEDTVPRKKTKYRGPGSPSPADGGTMRSLSSGWVTYRNALRLGTGRPVGDVYILCPHQLFASVVIDLVSTHRSLCTRPRQFCLSHNSSRRAPEGGNTADFGTGTYLLAGAEPI